MNTTTTAIKITAGDKKYLKIKLPNKPEIQYPDDIERKQTIFLFKLGAFIFVTKILLGIFIYFYYGNSDNPKPKKKNAKSCNNYHLNLLPFYV